MNSIYDCRVGAKRLAKVEMSPIRTILDRATVMRNQGLSVIPFSAGEPDFDTPTDIKEATIKAIQDNFTHYTSNRGYPNLRKTLRTYIERDTGVSYDPESEILVTSSGAEALNNSILSFVDKDDDVIVLTPSFINYKNLVNMCGANYVDVPLDTEHHFEINIKSIENAITTKTKMLILNNPNNPTGTVFNYKALETICKLAVKHNFLILSDEMYSRLIYDDAKFSSVASFPKMKEYSIIVSGFSKTFAMTGWRLGYIATDKQLANRILLTHQYSTTCSPTFIQVGLANAMESDNTQKQVNNMIAAFAHRRQIMIHGLSKISLLSYEVPYGAFYIMVDVSKLHMTGKDFAEKLLREKYVAAVPAVDMGHTCRDYIRISYATSEKNIVEGLRRIKEMVEEIRKQSDLSKTK